MAERSGTRPLSHGREVVRIRVPGLGVLGAVSQIKQMGPHRLVVVAPSEWTAPYQLRAGAEVEVGWRVADAVIWYRALVLDQVSPEGSAFVLELSDRPVFENRRDDVRTSVRLDLEVRTEPDAEPVRGWTIDVSGGGVQAAVPLALAIGDGVQMAICLPGEKPVRARALVVRHAGEGVFGFRFQEIAPTARERLIGLVGRTKAVGSEGDPGAAPES